MAEGPEEEGVVGALERPRGLWERAFQTVSDLSMAVVPVADSIAMSERADESRLSNNYWPDPVKSAHSVIRVRLVAVGDHLRSYARLFDGDPIPVFSHLVVARAAIESAGHVYWLAELVGVEKRVQRYALQRLANANAMGRSGAPAPARAKAKEIRENVRLGAAAQGWSYRSGKRKQSAKVGDEEAVSPRDMIDSVLAPPSSTSEMGDLLWWYLSGVTHGSMYALMQSIETVHDGANTIGGPLAATYTNSGTVAIVGQAVLESYVRATERAANLFGWESDDFDTLVAQTAEMGKELGEAVANERGGGTTGT